MKALQRIFFIYFLQNYLHHYIPCVFVFHVFCVCVLGLHVASIIWIITQSGGSTTTPLPELIRISEDLLYSFVSEAEDSLRRAGKEASCVDSVTATVSCDAVL
jgi:hypothetical protein